jgi:hypothetical protein
MQRALAIEASPETVRRIEADFDKLCVELVSDWLLGERRFESVSQQTEHWLARLYDVLYVDEQPEASRLYERFRLPLPRAQYLARLLMARRAGQWRKAARTELIATLGRLKASAGDAVEAGEGQVQRYDTSLSRGAYDELVVAYEAVGRAANDRERPAPPRKLPSSPTVAWFSITAETTLAILNHLEADAL